ncbi:MAG: phosphate acyltransferase PlsX [Endomicrobium sp.]|jgi:glycerol-3-phosphate acyltransferase PlsX|nr:phosphate acyltransferase PlsX [Endomicrobium sp.]
MIIALDAMGGDFAPSSTVEGAVLVSKSSKHKILLVGQEKILYKELSKYDLSDLNIDIINANEVITMGEHPAQAVRKKTDSSLAVCAKLVRDGKANAFVSMGNSGAIMAVAIFYLKRIPGILRPSISTIFPTVNGNCVMADIGANVDCKPEYLFQFAIMSNVFCKKVMKIKYPKIALISIGEEPTKGNNLSIKAFKLLNKSGINFIGNIEGKDVINGKADVVICDGFVGNVLLKFSEGIAETFIKLIKEKIIKQPLFWLAIPFLWFAIRTIKKKIDYSEFGGAPLLGVNEVCIIGHGRSNGKAIKNAIFTGINMVQQNMIIDIKKAIDKYKI